MLISSKTFSQTQQENVWPSIWMPCGLVRLTNNIITGGNPCSPIEIPVVPQPFFLSTSADTWLNLGGFLLTLVGSTKAQHLVAPIPPLLAIFAEYLLPPPDLKVKRLSECLLCAQYSSAFCTRYVSFSNLPAFYMREQRPRKAAYVLKVA